MPSHSPSKIDVAAELKKLYEVVGLAEEVLHDPYRHSLVILEMTQTLLKMQIEVMELMQRKGSTSKAQLTNERLTRLLHLTAGLDKIGDMNMDYQLAFREMRMENHKLQVANQKLQQEFNNYRAAMEAADTDNINSY